MKYNLEWLKGCPQGSRLMKRSHADTRCDVYCSTSYSPEFHVGGCGGVGVGGGVLFDHLWRSAPGKITVQAQCSDPQYKLGAGCGEAEHHQGYCIIRWDTGQ